jgi:hypothetical protein
LKFYPLYSNFSKWCTQATIAAKTAKGTNATITIFALANERGRNDDEDLEDDEL